MSQQRLEDPVAEEAIAWLVLIQSGDFSPAQQEALSVWRATSTHHGQVYEQLIAGLEQIRTSPWRGRPSAQLLRSLEQPSSRRTFLRNSLCAVGLAASVGWGMRLDIPGQICTTGTAQRRTWKLADGSSLKLNARSQVISRFDEKARKLELRYGEILVNVAADTARPLQIDTAAGSIIITAGRFMVSEQGNLQRVMTLEGEALLRLEGSTEQRIGSHQSTLFDTQRILSQRPALSTDTAWLDGWLVARNQNLASIVDALRPYRNGIVRLDPSVAELRVSGRFALDDARQTLEALERSLPISVTQWGGVLLLIGARASQA